MFFVTYTQQTETNQTLSKTIYELNAEKHNLLYEVNNLNQTIDNLATLKRAKESVKEPSENKAKPFEDRVSYLQQEVNSMILLHQDIYFGGDKYVTDPRVYDTLHDVKNYIRERYAIKSLKDAELKLQPIPIELSKAQAKLESGNGTSVYYKSKNNPYGMYEVKNKKLVPRSFDDLAHAVESYSFVLNSYYAMSKFRDIRDKTDSVYTMAKALSGVYSTDRDYHKMLKPLLD
jgi:flagellum-specific peptidoglycan hydrolase FlgJ